MKSPELRRSSERHDQPSSPSEVFSQLREIMKPYAGKLKVTADDESRFSLDTSHLQKNGKPLWFGGVEIKKNYVSYHLMAVYVHPELLRSLSPALKKRMQGKSCFNFASLDDQLFAELSELTRVAFDELERAKRR